MISVDDGRSDWCAAEAADLVFANGTLLNALRTIGQPCVPFTRLGDVYEELKDMAQ